IATPTVAAIRRCGSRVAASDITTRVTWPGCRSLMPWARDRIRHLGGKMLDTRTRLQAAMPAERSASSNEVSFSRGFPTPLVKNISLGTNPTTSRSLSRGICMVNSNGSTVKEEAAFPDRLAHRGGVLRMSQRHHNLALITIRYTNYILDGIRGSELG